MVEFVQAKIVPKDAKFQSIPPGIVKYADGSEHMAVDGRIVCVQPININHDFEAIEPCPRCELVDLHYFKRPIGPSIVYRNCKSCEFNWWEQ